MAFKFSAKKPVGLRTSPWVIMGTAIILLIIVVVLAIENINREKRYMAQSLESKGAMLISAVEAGARTGMMGMMWGNAQVQALLEETARLPDVLFLAVTDRNGVIVAHSDKSRIGGKIRDRFSWGNSDLAARLHWQIAIHDGHQRIFEVYRRFKPVSYADLKMRQKMAAMMKGHAMMMGQRKGWRFFGNQADDQRLIFVGLDMQPFEEARREDIKNTVIISSILLLLGVGGFLLVTYAQSYRVTRQSLQDASAFADEVVTHLPVGLIATDRQGRIAFFNAAAEKITGIRADGARGKDADAVLPDHWCGLEEYLKRGQPVLEHEMECTFAGGESIPVSASASRIVNEENQFVGNVLILRDLGEIRSLQEEIRRKEKLAALGRLAGGVAHEIRNPLSSIKGLATYFGAKFAEGSEDRETANVMVREVDRLNRVVSELLELSRPSKLQLRPTDIHELLAHSVRLVQQDARAKNIGIDLATGDDVPLAQIDPDRMTQCLLNIYLNAIEAMDAGAVLSIKSAPSGSNEIKIEISDTGKGISPDDLKKIFDPYFTTKPSGTGLGLAIVHKIIQAHEGTIKVKSSPGKGTVFSILLPIHAGGKA